MRLLKKAGVFFILITFLVIPITSCAITTTITDEAIQNDIYYILAFNSNTSASVENLPSDIEASVGEIITIPNQTPTREGYTFSGWNTSSDGSGAQYQPGKPFSELYQDTTLYAQWSQNQNYLSFNPNTTDDVKDLPANISYIPGDTINIPSQIPSREGYDFIGWNTSPDGTGTLYNPGDSLIAPENNLTLYAQWNENNSPIILVIILGIFFLLILIGIISLAIYYFYDNC